MKNKLNLTAAQQDKLAEGLNKSVLPLFVGNGLIIIDRLERAGVIHDKGYHGLVFWGYLVLVFASLIIAAAIPYTESKTTKLSGQVSFLFHGSRPYWIGVVMTFACIGVLAWVASRGEPHPPESHESAPAAHGSKIPG